MKAAHTPWHLLRRPRCLGSSASRPCLPIWRRNIRIKGLNGGNEDTPYFGQTADLLKGKIETIRNGILPLDVFEAIRTEMLARPPQITRDIMSPTNSTLLNIVLADHIPERCRQGKLDVGSVEPTQWLPEGHHLVYFPLQKTTSQLCPDGTDPYHSPGPPFDQRMWAGGSIEFNKPFWLNSAPAECWESIEDVTLKGPEGQEKIFVTVLRDYMLSTDRKSDVNPPEPRIRERRKLVFMRGLSESQAQARRLDTVSSKKGINFPLQPSSSFPIKPTPRLLFYYSALSFNAHLIHLDRSYCRDQEGHPNLLVHGPLSLTLMLSALSAELRSHQKNPLQIRRIDYRNLAPLYADEDMFVCVRPMKQKLADDLPRQGEEEYDQNWDVWIRDHDNRLSVRGTVEVGQLKDPLVNN
ncbi:hypothetical protein F4806DRAFT_39707 [Annulohypoxylon nitens]|nr:hypothetical protein F4806DRAFT_39707 [Annulohypoxylon nitens]